MHSKANKGLIAFCALFLNVIGQSGIDIYLPSFPSIVTGLHTTETLVQSTLTLFIFAFAISQLVYGPLSDRFGRRPVLFAGTAVFLLGSVLCATAQSINALLIARFIQGFGAGASSTLCRAIIRDTFEGYKMIRIISLATMSWAIVPIIAPLLGGYIQTLFGWRMQFIFLSVFWSIALLFFYFFLPETHTHTQSLRPKVIVKNYLTLLTSRTFVSYTSCTLVLYSFFVVFNVISPFLLQNRIGLLSSQYGWYTGFVFIGYFLGSYLNIHATHRFDVNKVAFTGFALLFTFSSAMLFLALLGIVNTLVVILPMFLIVFSIGLIYANCIAAAMSAFPKIAGSSGALFGVMSFAGSGLIGMTASTLPKLSNLPLALMLLTLCTVSALIFTSATIKQPKAAPLPLPNQ